MKTKTEYRIGPESIADYLQDMERRWGVKVVIELHYELDENHVPFLVADVHMPHLEHREEIPWAGIYSSAVRESAHQTALFSLWDMLYLYDRIIERGPQHH